MLMSPLLRRGFALFLLLLAASLLHPVDTTAQNLPGWAEVSEQRQSRFESQSQLEKRHHRERIESGPKSGRRHTPKDRSITPSPGVVTNSSVNSCNGNASNNNCEDACVDNPTADICQQTCSASDAPGWCEDRCSGSPDDPAFCANEIPVDDYLPLLMLAGIAYAALRLRQ
jgi:hypothetical protein